MSHDSWERSIRTGFRTPDENARRFHDHRSDVWRMEGETLHQNYNKIRDSEVQERNQEIFKRVIHFYFSGNGVIVLVISILLCLATSTFSPEGLFFWNIVLAGILWGFYEITVRKKIRAAWDDVWEEIETL